MDNLEELAPNVEMTFRVFPDLYLIGSLERGVTVYKQQVRAHNLSWALWELSKRGPRKIKRVAIVGGGISGLTMTACLISLFKEDISVTIFEQLSDLCPLQQGCDNRWLHPKIYDWPQYGSRAPTASLPVLNWSEGRASDVAKTLLSEFSRYCEAFAKSDAQLTIFLGLRHFQINFAEKRIDWIATKAGRSGAFFDLTAPRGDSAAFDTIILATGFGLEKSPPQFQTESYWRNEQIGQSSLDGTTRRYVISGYGDGALVDLCRVVVQRFRQDTVVYELFGPKLEEIEEKLRDRLGPNNQGAVGYDFFMDIESDLLLDAKKEVAKRVRTDTSATLHLAGRRGNTNRFQAVFGETSSFLNKMMLFLLYRCGAFSVSFADLETTVQRHGSDPGSVLCRHGADTMEQFRRVFVDYDSLRYRLLGMKAAQKQVSDRLWVPGCFPHI